MSTLGTDVLGGEVPLGTFADDVSDVAETATAADTTDASTDAAPAVAETATASDAVSASLVRVGDNPETATASDSVSVAAVLADSVGESAAATDVTNGIASAAIAETAPADDAISSAAVYGATVAESAPAADQSSAPGNIYVSVSEVATATDSFTSAPDEVGIAIRLVDPRYIDVVHWTRLMAAALLPHGRVAHWATEETWQAWAMDVRNLPALAGLQIPDPRAYDDWREWVFRFNNAVWIGGNGIP